ncbi:polyamine aminopropyltransferase [Limisalsivibrio acetivorans]|uniref:polyamine aminopropyltransferase n=1 Tax=Limisalsivibrio acetivorans TaxID=1304888 RepID=UPI0003B53E18|nr:polyamine aminopropyltransferase [Limisalsivibrio acetivorans]
MSEYSEKYTEHYEDGSSLSFEVKKLYSGESEYQKLDIYETEHLGNLMTLDGLVMLNSAEEFAYHEMIAHVPMFAHPNPQRVLVIGGGDGGTAKEVLRHECVKECVMVEIDNLVVEKSKEYFPDLHDFDNERLTLLIQDGVQYIKDNPGSFDVVLIDSTDPIGPAVGLFQEEFYKAVSAAMKEDGIFSAQSESPWMYKDIQKAMFADLKKVFPVVDMYLSFIPFYPSGMWSFAFASKVYKPFEKLRENDIKAMEPELKYFNSDIMRGCFALPTFAKEVL